MTGKAEERKAVWMLFKIIQRIGDGKTFPLNDQIEYYYTMKGMAEDYGPHWDRAAEGFAKEINLFERMEGKDDAGNNEGR
jgi:hypothetical protein